MGIGTQDQSIYDQYNLDDILDPAKKLKAPIPLSQVALDKPTSSGGDVKPATTVNVDKIKQPSAVPPTPVTGTAKPDMPQAPTVGVQDYMSPSATPIKAVDKSLNDVPLQQPPPNTTLSQLMTQRAAAGKPVDRSDPKYRMPAWQRVVGTLGNAMEGFATRGQGTPTYVGPGATNNKYDTAVAAQQGQVANLDEQIKQQKDLSEQNRKTYDTASLEQSRAQTAAARGETAEANKQKAEVAQQLADQKANQPPKASTAQMEADYQNGVAKLAAEPGGLPPKAASDVGIMMQAIDKSRTLSAQEKANMKGYLASRTTPSSSGTNTTIRIQGLENMANLRGTQPAIDTTTGSIVYTTPEQRLKEPGRYVDTATGNKDMPKVALINDIRQSAKQVEQNAKEFDNGTWQRLKVGAALADANTTPEAFLQSIPKGSLTDSQQQLVVDLFNLRENAMAMRSVLGAGQGSEDLRKAIIMTLPGASTPSASFAVKQLKNLYKTLDRVQQGVPTNIPQRGGTSNAAPAKAEHPLQKKYPKAVFDQ